MNQAIGTEPRPLLTAAIRTTCSECGKPLGFAGDRRDKGMCAQCWQRCHE